MNARILCSLMTVIVAAIIAQPGLALEPSGGNAAARAANEGKPAKVAKTSWNSPIKPTAHAGSMAGHVGEFYEGEIIEGDPMLDGGLGHSCGPGCEDGCMEGCDSGLACGGCGECESCCDLGPILCGWDIFADFLYLRARNAEVAYGVPVVAALANLPDVQRGPVGVVDQQYNPGFRAGIGFSLDDESCIRVAYTQYDAAETDAIETNAPLGIVALTIHPSTQSANTLFLNASATNHIAFEFIDVDFRRTWRNGTSWALDWVAGARYGRLEQDFTATYRNLVTDEVRTNLAFDGGGIRLGLEGECWNSHGFSFYGKGAASFLAGEFRGDYFHGNTPEPTILTTNWEAGRIVSILDVDMGVAWTSAGGHWRVTAGYLFSGWFNTVNSQWFIDRVRNNNFNELSEGLGFDGLAVRGELRF